MTLTGFHFKFGWKCRLNTVQFLHSVGTHQRWQKSPAVVGLFVLTPQACVQVELVYSQPRSGVFDWLRVLPTAKAQTKDFLPNQILQKLQKGQRRRQRGQQYNSCQAGLHRGKGNHGGGGLAWFYFFPFNPSVGVHSRCLSGGACSYSRLQFLPASAVCHDRRLVDLGGAARSSAVFLCDHLDLWDQAADAVWIPKLETIKSRLPLFQFNCVPGWWGVHGRVPCDTWLLYIRCWIIYTLLFK